MHILDSTMFRCFTHTHTTKHETGQKHPKGHHISVVRSHSSPAFQDAEDFVITLQSLLQPVIGVAMGRLDTRAIYIVSACDYIYSDGVSHVPANAVFNQAELNLACVATAETIDSRQCSSTRHSTGGCAEFCDRSAKLRTV